MIALALAFLAGGFGACFLPDRVHLAVRGLGGWVWARIKPLPAPVTQPLYGSPMVAQRLDIGAAIWNVISFCVRYWQIILLVVLFVFVAGIFKGCVHLPFFGESREHAITRANQAEGEVHTQLTINQRNAVISDIRAHVAIARVTLQHLREQGHAEIAAVTPPTETPLDDSLVGAWRAGLDRLCEYPRSDGSLPSACEPRPTR